MTYYLTYAKMHKKWLLGVGGRIPDDGNYAEESKQSPSSNIRQQISLSKVVLIDITSLKYITFSYSFSDFSW